MTTLTFLVDYSFKIVMAIIGLFLLFCGAILRAIYLSITLFLNSF